MSHPEKSAVPKFGSFKPKSKPLADTKTAELSPEKSLDSGSKDRKRSQRRERRSPGRHRHRHDKHDREHPSRGSEVTVDRQSSRSKASDIVNEFEESDLYIIDLRGDRKNVEYGGLHRYSVPSYYRTGYGRLIGAPSRVKIDLNESTDKEISLLSSAPQRGQRVPRLLTSKKHAEESVKLHRIVVSENMIDRFDSTDFLPFRPNKKRKLDADLVGKDAGLAPLVDYRSIEGKAKPSEAPSDDDLEVASDSGDEDASQALDLQIRQQNALLVKATKDRPKDAAAWTSLIDRQIQVLNPKGSTFTHSETRILADIKLSIYEKALRHIRRGDVGYEDLLLGLIESGSLIWDNNKLSNKWTELLKENPGSIRLWNKYLDFVQTDPTTFRYESCKATYLHCFKILSDSVKASSTTDRPSILSAYIYILLRFTTFVRDAGYDELALAIWQMLLEYYISRPSSEGNCTALSTKFGEFWDSEVPRIGEKDAQGWKKYALHQEGAERKGHSVPLTSIDYEDPFRHFAFQESLQMNTLNLPAAPDDDTAMADPFRHVMFSDLQDVLDYLPEAIPKHSIVDAFLNFMHLPQLCSGKGRLASHDWQNDQYLCTLAKFVMPSAQSESNMSSNVCGTSYALFQDSFGPKVSKMAEIGTLLNEVAAKFVDRVLETVALAESNDDYIMEYWLAFKLHYFPDEVSKVAKRALKARPSSLRLYNAYALIEARLGRMDKALGAWSNALGLGKQLNDSTSVLLQNNRVLFALELNDDQEALDSLLGRQSSTTVAQPSSVTRAMISPTEKLRASNYFSNGWVTSIDERRFEDAVLYAECSALLFYLTDDYDLPGALSSFKGWSLRLIECGANGATELLHQAKARLISLHIRRSRSFKPGIIRQELMESLRLFPENTMLLQLFSTNEMRFHLHDRLRSSMQSQFLVNSNSHVAYWSHTIATELHQYYSGNSGSTENSVRATFAQALARPDSSVKSSPYLWTQWLFFEHPNRYSHMIPPREASNQEKQKAVKHMRQIFLDGLRNLPWYKPWVIMGLKIFAEDGWMGQAELRRVYNILSERELRIRVDADEMDNAIAGNQ